MFGIVTTLIEKKMTEQKSSNLWNRALQNLQIAWNKIASDNKLDNEINLTPNLNQNDHKKIIKQKNDRDFLYLQRMFNQNIEQNAPEKNIPSTHAKAIRRSSNG